MAVADKKPLLDVRDLKTYFYTEDGVVRAVDGVNFRVYPGEVVGLVGESGCGKSVTSLSIMRLIAPPGKVIEGQILLDGQNLLDYPESEMIKVRGNRISMIFQQPQTAKPSKRLSFSSPLPYRRAADLFRKGTFIA